MTPLSLSNLQYIVIPGCSPAEAPLRSELFSIHEEAFKCWKAVWSATFQELDGIDVVYSDDFTRQHKIGCVMQSGKCLAVVFLRTIDFRLASSRHDSYFKVWSDLAVQKLVKDGPKVAVGSNITVSPQHRGVLPCGSKLKNLLLGLCIHEAFEMGADVMTGNLRRNKGMHKTGEAFDSDPIDSTFHHGVEVDLVAFYRRKLLASNALHRHASLERLWATRLDLTSKVPEDRKVEINKSPNEEATL